MLNLLKKLSLAVLMISFASCSSFKKNPEIIIQQTTEIRKVEFTVVENNEMFSVSKDEIQKSGTQPHVVYFATNSAKLNGEAVAILKDKILPDAKDTKTKKVVIEAHCDERGSVAYNQRLSLKRANAVKRYLIKNGVTNIKIETIGYGKSKPVALGHDEESWAKNRRAVTIAIRR